MTRLGGPYARLGLALLGLILLWMGWPWLRVIGLGLPLWLEGTPRGLPVPVEGVLPTQVAHTFGAPRPGGRRHRGVDVFAARGTRVLSTTPGVVAKVGWDPLGGKVVWVLGPGGEWHYFAHLDAFGDIRVGMGIPAAWELGRVGCSGNASGTPPHLHYGVYSLLGGATNPRPRLQPRHNLAPEGGSEPDPSPPPRAAPGAARGTRSPSR